MSFLIFPWWLTALLAAGAAAVPVLIHLLHRQRIQPVLWGAMQFLKLAPHQQRRRRKIENWLLLLMRIVVLVLLVLLLAWPRKSRRWSLLPTGGGTDVAVVIDHSLSTGRRSGESTVFEKSIAAVSQLAGSGALKGADSLSVILAEHEPRKLTPRPFTTADMGRLVADLRRLKPGLSDASVPDAIQAAREVLSHGKNGRKVVLVLSDEQRVGWKINDLGAWNVAVGSRVKGVEPDVMVYGMPIVPDAQAANVSVTDLTIAPALLGNARPATITATVSNSGSRDVPAQNARLIADGKQAGQQSIAPLVPGQSQTVRFEHTFGEPYSHSLAVQLDAADALEADNSAFAAAYVWPSIPVLVIDGQLTGIGLESAGSVASVWSFKNSRFLLNAMLSDAANPDAPALLRPTVISALDQRLATTKLDDFAAIVVNDVPRLPGGFMAKLPDYARSGHGVWFIFGKNTDRDFIAHSLTDAGILTVRQVSPRPVTASRDEEGMPSGSTTRPADSGAAPVVKDTSNAMFDLLSSAERGVFAGVSTYRWWSLATDSPDAKTVLAAAGTDDPLILERPIGSNGGRVILWTTSTDGAWNNWPSMKIFAPLVNVTVHQLAAGQTRGVENRRLASGQSIVWTGPATPPVRQAELTLPDGSKVQRRPVTRDGRQIITFDKTYMPGLYELRFDVPSIPQPVYYGVGLDRTELEPAALTADDQKWLASDDHKFIAERIDPSHDLSTLLTGGDDDQNRIWPWLAALVLISLLVETWITTRLIRRQTGPATLPRTIPPAAHAMT